MEGIMPATTTATELQRNYKKVAKKAKKLKKPLVILSNNKPEGVYIDYETYKREYKNLTSTKKTKRADFSDLSGVWTKKEADEFDRIIEDAFEKVDSEDWK
ncbi:hypothetical protein A2714_01640 [Candidatus Woesebacteria bacterium RIFCSPHIGHO2_01_FULL_38_9]|uniref:Antitoxin n=2 Tax=Candidatus Woeseibacteriota TaxID=1752722 RepID=A0A1F7XZL4_9BACT|nr:MAG: hypothetical protein A2714_01640 [Candidatus Woesebacteria bacterium RIFCSPHIGHO2_01_FULL_38_9]OGM59350.1 MAG: hypothetical protein A3A75_03280 [Candidatus Woesebacteria bacterium RIFCSPLOWO2_01_FULL_39_10]